MAIPSKYKIKFSCAHTEVKDLSSTPAGKRSSKAHWMGENFICSKCFKDKGQAELNKMNTQTLVEAEVFEQDQDLPELVGSEKQILWATRVRYELLSSGLEDNAEDEQMIDELLGAARTITRAGWWIDYKDADPDEVHEVVTTGAVKVQEQAKNDVVTENPF